MPLPRNEPFPNDGFTGAWCQDLVTGWKGLVTGMTPSCAVVRVTHRAMGGGFNSLNPPYWHYYHQTIEVPYNDLVYLN